jgi:hypothetical protein
MENKYEKLKQNNPLAYLKIRRDSVQRMEEEKKEKERIRKSRKWK